MALDLQRNWDIAMAENLQKITMKETFLEPRQKNGEKLYTLPPRRGTVDPAHDEPREPVYLPDEILVQILDYTSHWRMSSQATLASCCLVSHQWYRNAVPLLYAHPRLYGHNFDPFVLSICPSKNLAVRASPLAFLVRVLDMSSLVHQATKSTTARLLGRTKGNLETFIAPVRGFAMNAFPALSKSHNLRTLDLSLVSESPPLPDLFKALAHLTNLRTFRLPRSAGFGIHHSFSSFPWPPNLTSLSLSGGIDAHFLHGVVAFPPTLTSLTIEHCPTAKGFVVTHLLRKAVAPLKGLRKLRIAHMPRLAGHALDKVLFLLPRLEELSVSVDYITPALFDETHLSHIKAPLVTPAIATTTSTTSNASFSEIPHWSDHSGDPSSPTDSAHAPEDTDITPHLRVLELTYSGTPADITDKISPLDIMIAIDDGALPHLRQVRVATSLMWPQAEAESLSDVLAERAALKDGESGGKVDVGKRVEAGVWRFEG